MPKLKDHPLAELFSAQKSPTLKRTPLRAGGHNPDRRAKQKQFRRKGRSFGRNSGLARYRKTYDNFEDYCKAKFGCGRRYANRLIQASKIAISMREWDQKNRLIAETE